MLQLSKIQEVKPRIDMSKSRVRFDGEVMDKYSLARLLDDLLFPSYYTTVLYDVTSYKEMCEKLSYYLSFV